MFWGCFAKRRPLIIVNDVIVLINKFTTGYSEVKAPTTPVDFQMKLYVYCKPHMWLNIHHYKGILQYTNEPKHLYLFHWNPKPAEMLHVLQCEMFLKSILVVFKRISCCTCLWFTANVRQLLELLRLRQSSTVLLWSYFLSSLPIHYWIYFWILDIFNVFEFPQNRESLAAMHSLCS